MDSAYRGAELGYRQWATKQGLIQDRYKTQESSRLAELDILRRAQAAGVDVDLPDLGNPGAPPIGTPPIGGPEGTGPPTTPPETTTPPGTPAWHPPMVLPPETLPGTPRRGGGGDEENENERMRQLEFLQRR